MIYLMLLQYAFATPIYKIGGETTSKETDAVALFHTAKDDAFAKASAQCPNGYSVLTQTPTPPIDGYDKLIIKSGNKNTVYFDITLVCNE